MNLFFLPNWAGAEAVTKGRACIAAGAAESLSLRARCATTSGRAFSARLVSCSRCTAGEVARPGGAAEARAGAGAALKDFRSGLANRVIWMIPSVVQFR